MIDFEQAKVLHERGQVDEAIKANEYAFTEEGERKFYL